MWDVASQTLIWKRDSHKASTGSSRFHLEVTHATSVHIPLAKASYISESDFEEVGKYNPSVSRDTASGGIPNIGQEYNSLSDKP